MLLSLMANQLDHYFTALSDPTRRAVVERLMQGPAPVSELHQPYPMALPSFMKHLKVLEDTGLTRSEKKGRVRIVHIEATALDHIADWVKDQRQMWNRRLDQLQALAETPQVKKD